MAKNIEAVYPLTPVQEGLLFHSVQSPDSGVYLEQLTCRIKGEFDVAAWQLTWEQIVARHPALRSLFTWDGRKQPLQIVRERVDVAWAVKDWRGTDNDLQARLEANKKQGFDLAVAPLMRFTLLQLTDSEWQFVWDRHHIVMDGWSNGLLFDEAIERYNALREGKPFVVRDVRPYRDFVGFAKQHGALDEPFWKQYLGDFDEPILLADLIGDGRETTDRYQFRRRISAETTQKLQTLARETRVTLNHIVQAAWAYVLHRYSDRDDIVFGATVSGRPAALPGADRMIGLFLNTLPLRVRINHEQTVREWLPTVRDAAAAIANHEQESLAEIQQFAGRHPLFDSLIVFVNYYQGGYVRDIALSGAKVSEIDYHEYSHYPLGVIIVPDDELELWLIGDEGVFSAETIQILTGALHTALWQFATNPDWRVAGLTMTSGLYPWGRKAQRHHLIHPPPKNRNLDNSADSFIRECPADKSAIRYDKSGLSYRELNVQADLLARRLVADGVQPGDRVAVELPRSAEQIVAMLAVLRAGAAYVPVDPAYPPPRRTYMKEDAAVAAVLNTTTLAMLPSPTGELPEPDPERNAYLIYTSGSTGKPKGVPITHKQLVHSTLARHDVYGKFDGRFLLLSSFSFDSSVVGIYRSLIDGGTLVLPQAGEERDPDALVRLIESEQITELLCLPSLWSVILETAVPEQLRSLQTVIVAGEACSAETIRTHLALLPHVDLYNEYGPTEGTVWASAYKIETVEDPVPIGMSIPSMHLHVVDSLGRPVPPGAPGELWIMGEGVTAGYWNRPKLTAEKFPIWHGATFYRTGDRVRRRPDGNLLFLGRIDSQVKVRGYRVEPLEIERVLQQHPDLSAAAVIVLQDGVEARLVAHVVGSSENARTWLRQRMPEYMIPTAFIEHVALPQTPNGKVDRVGLRDRHSTIEAKAPDEPPITETEQFTAQLWQELLKTNGIGRNSDFFALGGHSLLVMRLMARLRKQFAVDLAVDLPFRAPTLRELSAEIDSLREEREEFEI